MADSLYASKTACGRNRKVAGITTPDLGPVTCDVCRARVKADHASNKNLGNFEPIDDMIGTAKLRKETHLKECIRLMISENLVKIRTASGKEYEGDKNRIATVLAVAGVSHYRVSDILSDVPIESKELRSLLDKNIVTPVRHRAEPKTSKTPAFSAQRKLDKAIKSFAKNWTNFKEEMTGVAPEDAAADAALNFFHDFPEWEEYAKALQLSKEDVRSSVADWVYTAMETGKV